MTIMIISSGEDLRIIKNFKDGGRTDQFLEDFPLPQPEFYPNTSSGFLP